MLLEGTVLFDSERIYEMQVEARVCNHYSILTLHSAGLRIYNGKRLIRGELEHNLKEVNENIDI